MRAWANRAIPGAPGAGWPTVGRARRPGWPPALLPFGLLIALWHPADAFGMDRVRAQLGQDTAWTGEAVSLIITLYSSGPFSGTAAFDLPELPALAFVRAGNPLVGSESIDGNTYLTQRHEFAIYTQRAGDVVVPAFRVRFAGKRTFTSPAEPMAGFTPALRFRSVRPPGTKQLGVVVTAGSMKASQTWQPDSLGSVKAGDVITRDIVRRAAGTTAMMLPPVSIETPPGVRHYVTDPTVQDFTERGASLAVRSETIKYQFERPGTFQLPDVAVTWWDPAARALQRVTLPGRVVNVAVAGRVEEPEEPPAAASGPRWRLAVSLLLLGIAAGMCRKSVVGWLTARRLRHDDPASVAARRLLAACRSNAAIEAYVAGLQWKRAVGLQGEGLAEQRLPPGVAADFEREWHLLSRHVYGAGETGSPWAGERLAGVFADLRRALGRTSRAGDMAGELPALNPVPSRARRSLRP